MKTRKLLVASLLLNFVLIALILAFAIIYRDKILQRFVSIKGNPTIVMYGNSLTAQGKWVELLGRTDVMNNGLPGLCTYHFLQLIQTHVVDLKPEICFLEGGINDITVGVSQEKIQANFKSLLDILVKNNIKPVVTLTPFEQNDPISKAEVIALNRFLVDYCQKHSITYIDLNAKISDTTGLKPAFAVDKTHLNAQAYRLWAAEIKRVLQESKL
ncbi:SGNH/GDSL hydrolase family protein [Dyadobacter crusticola]|uniref:SGNH/GDSL hydrolase family protein n=1 Tax=Dyadobacter crusticola TaxID=292407 RepID=UPI0004E1F171|nr:GDSL-type esterase/lipase family protein [Dyadobacter crusticola]